MAWYLQLTYQDEKVFFLAVPKQQEKIYAKPLHIRAL
tara:strand:- start:651 stop:761 length:111 start_codon:yes stop_codon:yes gene_type:complete